MSRRVAVIVSILGLVPFLAWAEGNEPTAAPSESRIVEEVVVTANRRTQSVQDIVGGVQVFDGEDLEKSGSAGFADYVFKIPGADLVDDGATKKVALRGSSNMTVNVAGGPATASPVAIYLNDTPIQGNGMLPDLGLYDLERIEVLKGPQGTLYGEGAQGGAFKMLLNRADPSELSAKGEVSVGQTKNGSGVNHAQNLAVNVPVSGSWAVRVVGSRRVEQGFIDYFNRGAQGRGENDATNLMGRVHVDGDLWDGFSLSAMMLHQRQRLDQFANVQFSEGDLRNRDVEPQFMDVDFTLAALTLEYDLGFAVATSSTSGFLSDRDVLARFPFFQAAADSFTLGVGDPPTVDVDGEWIEAPNQQFGIAQELRLVSSEDSWLHWVAGVFYRQRENDYDFLGNNGLSDSGDPPGYLRQQGVETHEQIALFGEATLDLPWNLELGLGLRGFREDVGFSGQATWRGPLLFIAAAGGNPSGDFPPQSFGTETTALTPKVALSWFADEFRMLYAQAAQGVRSGGNNSDATYVDVPPNYEPDTLWSYEIGAKTQWLDGLVTANVAAFYNVWQDLQVVTILGDAPLRGPVPFPQGGKPVLNAGKAVVRGAEVSLGALPAEGLTLGFNLALSDGEIVEGDSTGTVPDHSPLPQLAKLSYSAFAGYTAYRWPILGYTPTFQFDMQSTGPRIAAPEIGVEYPLDGFQTFNALVGLEGERWDLSFGVKNLTDARSQLGANLVGAEHGVTIGRPRTWTFRMGFRY